jgi:hypothetical protein
MDRNKLLVAIISFGIIGVCITCFGKEREKGDESPVAEEKAENNEDSVAVKVERLNRDPFSLPAGVSFLEKKKKEKAGDTSVYTEWKEGVVASNLNGIYQSGKNVTANINGVWVKEGDLVGEERVIDIRWDSVILGGKGGVKRALSLKGIGTELKVIEKVKPVSN